MKNIIKLFLSLFSIILISGCYATSQAVISEIEDDKVKVTITSDINVTIDSSHEAYASVVLEAQKGCADKEAIEISVSRRNFNASTYGVLSGQTEHTFLFACVEKKEKTHPL